MIKDRAKHKTRYVPSVCFLVLMSLGCLCLPSGIMPTDEPPAVPGITELPGVEPPVVESPAPGIARLFPEGPWLLVETERGLWAANPDGSKLTQITGENFFKYVLHRAVQPGGNLVAFLSPAEHLDFAHRTLNMISFPDGRITKITDLTSPETEEYVEDGIIGPLQAIHQDHSFAWSPDGSRFAFIGLMDGPSADVYLYDAVSGDITRVSDNNDQEYWVSWSPDGNKLLYFSGTFMTGFRPTGIWIADGDGTDSSLFYLPESSDAELIGWLDSRTFVLNTGLVTDGGKVLGNGSLRLFDIDTGDQVVLSDEGNLLNAEVDTLSGTLMFRNYSGMYFVNNVDRTPIRIEGAVDLYPITPGEDYFTVSMDDGSLATYQADKNPSQISPIQSCEGIFDVTTVMEAYIGIKAWAWTCEAGDQPGVWVTGHIPGCGGTDCPDTVSIPVFEGNALLPVFTQDYQLLFFASTDGVGNDLYRTDYFYQFEDLEVIGRIDAEVINAIWLGGE